jgi:Fe-S-cluster-containing hydrogenase component 2
MPSAEILKRAPESSAKKNVDRGLGKSIVCNQCEGDPTCVKVCPSGALEYVNADQVNISLKRAAAQRILNAQEIIQESPGPLNVKPDQF